MPLWLPWDSEQQEFISTLVSSHAIIAKVNANSAAVLNDNASQEERFKETLSAVCYGGSQCGGETHAWWNSVRTAPPEGGSDRSKLAGYSEPMDWEFYCTDWEWSSRVQPRADCELKRLHTVEFIHGVLCGVELFPVHCQFSQFLYIVWWTLFQFEMTVVSCIILFWYDTTWYKWNLSTPKHLNFCYLMLWQPGQNIWLLITKSVTPFSSMGMNHLKKNLEISYFKNILTHSQAWTYLDHDTIFISFCLDKAPQ